MRHPGTEKYALLTPTEDGGYRVTHHTAGAAHLCVVAPGHRIEVSEDGEVSFVDWRGQQFSLDEAVDSRRAKVVPGYNFETQAPGFKAMGHNMIRSILMPRILMSREKLDDWELEAGLDRVTLKGPHGRTGSYVNPRWWKVADPNFHEVTARELSEEAGLRSDFGIED